MYSKFKKYLIYRKVYKKRKQLKSITTGEQCVKFLQEYNSVSDMLDFINILFIIEPPSDIELQKLSLLQQKYDKNDIFMYATQTIWLASVYYICATVSLKRQHSWP
jgi:hypothetical protein